ncbi:sortilin isoform X2 [Hydra vulgaris]|uniref:Sortilin isoform X2 n=1 Tax=Hydra vulgaris TaxID=6087 RepID=A0ABM4C608_HYDVU
MKQQYNKMVSRQVFIIFSFCVTGSYLSERYIYFGGHDKSGNENFLTTNVQHSRVKRSTLNEDAKKKIQSNKFVLKDEKNFDFQLFWLGEDSEVQLLLTTIDAGFLTIFGIKNPSKLYKSTNDGLTFENIGHLIEKTEIRSKMGIMKSPLNSNMLILISYSSTNMFSMFLSQQTASTLVITKDAGITFKLINIPFTIKEGSPILFHPTKEDWLMVLDSKGGAWLSKDFGTKWMQLMKDKKVSSVKWGTALGKEGEEIYLSTYNDNPIFSFLHMITSSSTIKVWKSSDNGKSSEGILEHCFNFGVQGDFVFASISLPKVSEMEKDARLLHVSKDSGKTFHLANVPKITADMFYAVLDMNNGMVFLHVDSEGNTGFGTLYISDADGIEYTTSLENHFYTNNGVTDFIRVTSMEGVYITQKLAPDNTILTVITFDRGVVWNPLYVDSKKYCKSEAVSCNLHLHISYSIDEKGVPAQPPLFTENAPGIILAHGQAGDALTGVSNVWLSQNGGYNWTQVAEGPHHYAIADNGNLIVIYPETNSTENFLKYSVDQGDSWNNYKFSNESDLYVKGLVAETHSLYRTFSLWGYKAPKNASEREWFVITISFKDIFTKECTKESFITWYPHALNKKDGCILGQKTTYIKPSPDKECFIGKSFDPVLKREKCNCTKDDLECDYGYKRQTDGSCKRIPSIELEKVCLNGEEYQKNYSRGFRRIPGDLCESKEAIDDVVKYIDEHKQCAKLSVAEYYGIAKLEEEIMKTPSPVENKKGIFAPVLLIGCVIVLLGIFAGVWYYKKRNRSVTNHATFSYMHQNNEENFEHENSRYNPRPKGQRTYKDETEGEDDEVLIPI